MQKIRNEELNRLTPDEFRKAEKTPLVIVLDNVRSMNNVGSVFRTADAFLCESIILCGLTPVPPHREIHKTALGATETVEWLYAEHTLSAVQTLQQKGYKVYAIEQVHGSMMLDKFQPLTEDKIALVFGNEVEGVQQDVVDACNGCIEIPQLGMKHSLNIAVSAGIVIWDVFNKLKS
ncbi:MAG: RNA methyltransferase [Bacteroidia bacterium]